MQATSFQLRKSSKDANCGEDQDHYRIKSSA